jgi:hypothetical protein
MLAAAHGVTIERGDVILSAELLSRIYEAMRAREPINSARYVSYACPVCAASLEPSEDSLRIACQDGMVLYTPAHDPEIRPRPVAVVEASGVDDVEVEADGDDLDSRVRAMREAISAMHIRLSMARKGS